MKDKRRRPWLVFGRSLGVVYPVARYGREDRAYERAHREGLFVLHVDRISPDLVRALGVKT